MNNGSLFIISGPSGSGKDTILREVLKACDNLQFSISTVSRPMQEGEKQGEKYNFVTREEFIELINTDKLLEYNEYCGNYYGTPRDYVEDCINQGKNIMIEVDVNGAASIRRLIPDAVSVFIMPPSLEVLRERLFSRGREASDVIDKRFAEAKAEIKRAKEYDYIIVNDVLEEACEDFMAVIRAHQLRTEKNTELIDEVISDVKSSDR